MSTKRSKKKTEYARQRSLMAKLDNQLRIEKEAQAKELRKNKNQDIGEESDGE